MAKLRGSKVKVAKHGAFRVRKSGTVKTQMADKASRGYDIVIRNTDGTVTFVELKTLATRVTGSASIADAWLVRRNPLLGNLSPKEAVEQKRGKEAIGLLINIAGG